MFVFTSVNNFYLPKARVLAHSVKKFHPNWTFVLLLADKLPEHFDLNNEPFDEVLLLENLPIDNIDHWMFQYNVEELCTAIKPVAAKYLIKSKKIKKLLYLDPDTKVFNSLQIVSNLLNKHQILLTPHLLSPEKTIDGFLDNELSASKHGVYNLGFFALTDKAESMKFLDWWGQRLKHFCITDTSLGLWTDQKLCDFVPAFFNHVFIIKHPGFNVATWNIPNRIVSRRTRKYYINAKYPLIFYHFTGFDSGEGKGMLLKYANNNEILFDIWKSYVKDLQKQSHDAEKLKHWHYGFYNSNKKIQAFHRQTYTQSIYLQNRYPNPFKIDFYFIFLVNIISIKSKFLSFFKKTPKLSGKYYSI